MTTSTRGSGLVSGGASSAGRRLITFSSSSSTFTFSTSTSSDQVELVQLIVGAVDGVVEDVAATAGAQQHQKGDDDAPKEKTTTTIGCI